MTIEIIAPSPGESITEVELGSWLVQDGEYVEKDQEIAEIESDKATLPIVAEQSGQIKILVTTGETVNVGTVIGMINTDAKGIAKKSSRSSGKKEDSKVSELLATEAKAVHQEKAKVTSEKKSVSTDGVRISPVARKMMEDHNLSVKDILSGLKRITSKEVNAVIAASSIPLKTLQRAENTRQEERIKMSQLRKKLGQRLVAVKNETAMLTTFNEVDMREIIRLRKTYQATFSEKHGVKLGFMSFFIKAVTQSLRSFPNVNARIEGEEIVIPEYCDIGIAMQTDKGLMVPVIRNAESMTLSQLETRIQELADRARANRISLSDLAGGTFSITNGGVFGSLLSTPIINPPQSGILGMHTIKERPVSIDGKIEIRPMMYVAFSYDHRIIDGKDSVSFLVNLKTILENPVRLLVGGKDPDTALLDI